MMTFWNLSKKPGIFKGFTGVTVVEFEDLEEKITGLWVEQEKERLKRPNRQRAVGGGRKQELDLCGQLLLTLIWLRLYLTTELLGYLFGIDKSTVSRYTHRMLPIMRQVGEATLGWPEPPKRGETKNIDQAREDYPELFAFVDATEQPVRRSKENETQKAHYSGKKKRHTRKAQVIVNEDGVIRDVSQSVPGSVHDRKLFTLSEAADKIPKQVVAGGDTGYQGIQDDLPDHSVLIPFKKSKHHPLTDQEKLLNQEFSQRRIVVENTIGELKHFNALAQTFRHSLDIWDDVFRSIVAVVNPRIQARVDAASAA